MEYAHEDKSHQTPVMTLRKPIKYQLDIAQEHTCSVPMDNNHWLLMDDSSVT
jgi:hypothetical protein